MVTWYKARFPSKQSLALRALRLDGNRSKRKRLRWQAANHGCQRKRLRLDGNRASLTCLAVRSGEPWRAVADAGLMVTRRAVKAVTDVRTVDSVMA